MNNRLLISILFLSLTMPLLANAQELYDVAILGGRVMGGEHEDGRAAILESVEGAASNERGQRDDGDHRSRHG